MDIFKFELSNHDMAALGKLERTNKNYSSLNSLSYVNVAFVVCVSLARLNSNDLYSAGTNEAKTVLSTMIHS